MRRLSLVLVLIALAGAVYGKGKNIEAPAPLPPVVDLGADTTICPGATLTLNATVPGAATYLWQDGSVADTLNVTQAGLYSVTVTEGGESAADTIEVSVFDVPQIELGSDTTLCLGDSLVLDVSEFGVTVLWPDGSRGDRYTVYNSTRVGIEVRTRDGCVVSDVIQVTFVPKPPVDLGEDIEVCEGESVVLDASVPGNVTYTWNDGNTQSIRTEMAEGTYAVTVSDQGCSVADTIDVTVNAIPVVDLGPTDTVVCGAEPIILDLGSASGPVLWSDGSTANTFTVTNSGQVWARVSNSICSASDTIDVALVNYPDVDLGPAQQEVCAGDTVTFDASVPGMVTYTWQDGSTDPVFAASAAGLYIVEANDRGCTAADSVQLTVNPLPVVSLGPDTSICGNEQLVLDLSTVTGTISWPDGSTGPTFTVEQSGLVQVQVTDDNCSATDAIDVTLKPSPPVDLGLDSREVCEGETVALDATVPGNATYTWTDGITQATRTVAQGGLYTVIVNDGECTASDSVLITVRSLPDADLGPDTLVCGANTLELQLENLSGVATWPDGSTGPTFTVTSSGTVTVQVTANNCSVSDAVNVNFAPLPPVDIGPAIQEICEGESVTFDATVPGNATYEWEDGTTQPVRSLSETGTYQVTVVANGCPAGDEVQLTVNPLPLVDLGGTDTLVCDQESLQFDLSSLNGTITWPDGSTGPTYTTRMSGLVQVEVNRNNCVATDEIQVNFSDSPEVDLGPPSISLCQDEPYVIQTQDPTANYIWNDGSIKTSLTVEMSGAYWVQAEKGGCTASDTIEVELTAVPEVNLGGAIDACEGQPVTLDAGNPGAIITWQDGTAGPLFTVTESGTYSVTVKEGACEVEEQVSVQFRFTPEVDLGEDQLACAGEILTLDPFVSNADELRWQDGSTGFTLQVNISGLYWLEAEVDGCADRDSVLVTFQAPPAVDLGEDRAICDDQATILRAGRSGDNVRWSTGAAGNVLRVESPGLYWAEVNDGGACTARDSIQLEFLPCGTDNIFVPSAFSPNGDDTNEELQIFIHPDYELIDYELLIFDRWGEIVFETQNPDDRWDGTHRGQLAQQGVYVFLIRIKFIDGIGKELDTLKYGDVAIVR